MVAAIGNIQAAIASQRPPPDTLLQDALDYHHRGLCVLPVALQQKLPLVRWKRYQQTRPSRQVLRRWCSRDDIGGLAILTGSVSGGLCIRDYDDLDAYEKWAAAHPDLAKVLPTVATSRGRHVYCRAAAEVFAELADGELRGRSTHYCIAPPSIHPAGAPYTWLTPLPAALADLPVLDPVAAGLLPPDPLSGGAASDTSIACVNSAFVSTKKVDNILRETQPTRTGQRNRCLFKLARELKAVEGLNRAEDAEQIVRQWFTLALPTIRTKEWAETWKDFTVAWGRVRWPCGANLVGLAEWIRSRVNGSGEHAELMRLEYLFEALDERHGGKPFHLSVRIAGALIGVSHEWANRLMRRLESAGVIAVVKEGDRKARLAREWTYAGPKLLRLVNSSRISQE